MKNAGVLTLSEFKSMRDRLYGGGMTEEQEQKAKEVSKTHQNSIMLIE